jgi:hypothetical protein
MPTMANITVKKADGTTDIVYDAVTASGGENSPAVWRQDTGAPASLPPGLRQTLKVSTKWNGPKTARQLIFEFSYPYAVQDTTTTLYAAKDKVLFTGIITIPQSIPNTLLAEACNQGPNLIASALFKAAANMGYAPV